MTDDIAAPSTIAPSTVAPSTVAPDPPGPGFSMPTPTKHRHPPKRNAKPKRPPPRHRNAAASAPAPRSTATKSKGEPLPLTKKQTFVNLVETLGGAGAASIVGAYAVKWGLHPELVSAGLSIAGSYVAWQSPKDLTRNVAAGAASAAGSQLALMWLNPGPAAPKTAPAQTAPAPMPAQPALLPGRHADLGSLPPGMLDAAFERARSELAVAGDGYPHDYEHDHHPIHHGPVMR